VLLLLGSALAFTCIRIAGSSQARRTPLPSALRPTRVRLQPWFAATSPQRSDVGYEPGMEAPLARSRRQTGPSTSSTAVVSGERRSLPLLHPGHPPRNAGTGLDLRFMPAVNASLNALSAAATTAGCHPAQAGPAHRYCQVSALRRRAFFSRVSRVHFVHGDSEVKGRGTLRAIYLVILTSHIVLSVASSPWLSPPFTFLEARLREAPRDLRVTLPIWLYVSVTGGSSSSSSRSVPAVRETWSCGPAHSREQFLDSNRYIPGNWKCGSGSSMNRPRIGLSFTAPGIRRGLLLRKQPKRE